MGGYPAIASSATSPGVPTAPVVSQHRTDSAPPVASAAEVEEIRLLRAEMQVQSEALKRERKRLSQEQRSMCKERGNLLRERAALVKKEETIRSHVFASATPTEGCAVASGAVARDTALGRPELLKVTSPPVASYASAHSEPLQQALCAYGSGLNLSVLEHGPWLAAHLGLTTGRCSKRPSPSGVTVVLDIANFWPRVWAALPTPSYGSAPHTQYFGLLFGVRDEEGVLQLKDAELCSSPFRWEPDVSARADVSALAEDLNDALRTFLVEAFGPWANNVQEQGDRDPPAAWLVCNDGEAFALSNPILQSDFASGSCGSTVVVCDRAKSNSRDATLEVVELSQTGDVDSDGPRRVAERRVYDVRSTS